MQVGGKGLAQKPEIQTIVGPESETMVVCGQTACAQSQLGLLSAIVSRDGLRVPAPGSCPHPSFMSPIFWAGQGRQVEKMQQSIAGSSSGGAGGDPQDCQECREFQVADS